MEVGGQPLRLNSEPVPADVMPLATRDHAARVAAATTWLQDQCGDYAPLRRQFIAAYLRCLAMRIDAQRDALADRLRRYDGLFAPEDFLWSALRPLPRGFVPVSDRYLPADFVFWDGAQVIAIEVAARDTEKQKALSAAGVMVDRISAADFDCLPSCLARAWDVEGLPTSPFRRAIPPLPRSGGS